VHTRLSGSTTLIATLWRRGAAIPLGLIAVGALVTSLGGAAAAAPQPTIAQVQAQLNQLNAKAQVLDQQYDQAQQQLTAANVQLGLINDEIARYQARYKSMRRQVAQIATAAYENGTLSSPEVLLTSSSPQQILNDSSILQELSSVNSAALAAFVTTAKQLASAQQAASRVSAGKLAIRNQLASKKNQNANLIAQQQALMAQLSPAQQADVTPGGGAVSDATLPPGALATSAQGQAVVEYAFAQVQDHCPYVFGAAGPCGNGFDCSGLVMAAWAAAGVSVPRTSEEQAGLPSIATSQMRPGDIMEFAGDSHVGIYVGGGMLIDAPHSGLDVEEVAFSGWYSENFDGAFRPVIS
jgi:cell wall-associated NlpC family hydrolase